MKKESFREIIILAIMMICLSAVNAMAVDLQLTKFSAGGGSDLFNPVFPDVQLPDFNLSANSSTPGLDYSAGETSVWSDYEKLHKYFGIATIALAGVAAVSSSNKSLHYGSAYAATGTALLTCWTGHVEYPERFDIEEGLFARDNLHILLGAIGTVAIATAVATADSGKESSHEGLGVAGGSLMVASVVVIKMDF